jgi:copper resistance protein D
MDDPFIWVRAIHFAATILVAGAVWFAVFIAEPAFRKADDDAELVAVARASVRVRLSWLAWLSLAVVLLSGAAWLLFAAARMADLSLPEVFAGTVVETVVTQTGFGHAWIVRLLLAALVAIAWCVRTQIDAPLREKILLVSLTAALVGTLAWSGHAAAGRGVSGTVHLTSDILHLLAAAAWLGGLLPLAITLRATARGSDVHLSAVAREAVARFSILGIVSVGTLIATGLVNSWMLVGNVAALTGTDYGRVLCAKLALFLCMVTVAGVNRLILTPRLRHKQGETARLTAGLIERNSLIEGALGAIILIAVGLLGTLQPFMD